MLTTSLHFISTLKYSPYNTTQLINKPPTISQPPPDRSPTVRTLILNPQTTRNTLMTVYLRTMWTHCWMVRPTITYLTCYQLLEKYSLVLEGVFIHYLYI